MASTLARACASLAPGLNASGSKPLKPRGVTFSARATSSTSRPRLRHKRQKLGSAEAVSDRGFSQGLLEQHRSIGELAPEV